MFASGLADIELSNPIRSQLFPEIVKVVFATVAIVLYVALTVISGQIIFTNEAQPPGNGTNKQSKTRFVYWLFVAELLASVLLLATNVLDNQLTAVLVSILGEC